MSFDAERAAIEGLMLAQWKLTPYAAVPVEFEGTPLKTKPANTPWLAFYIRRGSGEQVSLGANPVDRHVGVIIASIFVPATKGAAQAAKLGDAVAAIFKRASFVAGASTIKCRVPHLEYVGQQEGWLHFDVSVPYHRDEQN